MKFGFIFHGKGCGRNTVDFMMEMGGYKVGKSYMDFGMPTLIENKNLKENLQLCKLLGLQFIELNMNLPEYQINRLENSSMYQEIMGQENIYFTIHLDENLNVADFNCAVADAYSETVKRTIAVAEKLHIPILNMHMNHGVYFTLPNQKVQLFEQYFDVYMESMQKFMDMCRAEIGSADICICIENTDGFRSYEKSAIEKMLDKDVFALTWDIGHSNSCGDVDEAFFMKHERRLKHFHIHDSLGTKDHMTLGTGEVNLQQRLEIAQKNGCRCVVETKTVASLKESVKWLEENNYKTKSLL